MFAPPAPALAPPQRRILSRFATLAVTPSPALEILSSNSRRAALVLSAPNTSYLVWRLGDPPGALQGLITYYGTAALVLHYQDVGEMLFQPLWVLAGTGSIQANVIESFWA